jgi:hypothetical protein
MQLGDEYELGVVRLMHLVRDPPDHVRCRSGLGGELARHSLHPACLLDDASVAKRDSRVRGETLECADVVLVEGPHLETADGEGRRDLALDHDGHRDDRAHADVLDRRDRRRVGRIVVPRDGAARSQDRTDDAETCRCTDTDGALAGARAGDHGELVAATPVDRRVVCVDEKQCVPGDRPEQRLRGGLLPDLSRDALKAARETQRASAGALLAAVMRDRRAQDEEHQDHHDRLAEDLGHGCRCPQTDADRFLSDATDEVGGGGRGHAVPTESIDRERSESHHDDERDAPLVRGARDHPDRGGGEVPDHRDRRRLG